MSDDDAHFHALCRALGISASYRTPFGGETGISRETLVAAIAALGHAAGNGKEISESLRDVNRLNDTWLPMTIVAESGCPIQITPRSASPDTVTWALVDEEGKAREGRASFHDGTFMLPALRLGYYRLEMHSAGMSASAILLVAPRQCWLPPALEHGERRWGMTTQIYSLRSARNLGIGDYSDIAAASKEIGAFGGAFLGLSPLHALFPSDRAKYSPYSPSSRLFLETQYIDPIAIPGFRGSRAQSLLTDHELAMQLAALREASLLDYDALWAFKRRILETLWAISKERDADALRQYRRQGGDALERHATFDALSETLQTENGLNPSRWPSAFQDPGAQEISSFRAVHADRIAFYAWLQLQAETQLDGAAEIAQTAGLPIGLYRDLAVGADPFGSEVWSHSEYFVKDLSAGAPPDPFNWQGQNWGFPPFHPLKLAQFDYQPFRDVVRANMRAAGAIRIDHAFQLQRMFLFPIGHGEGTYIDYPMDALIAILKIESHRNHCLVIAEDLGSAPEGFSERIMMAGLLSYRLLWFERESGNGQTESAPFKSPQTHPKNAMVAFTTHDLPTFSGWWHGVDIESRETHGLLTHEAAEAERKDRALSREALTNALKIEKLSEIDAQSSEAPLISTTRYLARAPSLLLAISLDDVVGERNQPNIPGPDTGYPNWRRRLPVSVEEALAPAGPLSRIGAALAEEGRGALSHRYMLAAPPPRATYRLQLNKDFTFSDAQKIVPYLADLGISHVYASPILTARPGSAHGYDIIDHNSINPELGGEGGFIAFSDTLHAHDMGLILDIVPNHMAVGGRDNQWWLSVLEWGPSSPHADTFDIDWDRLGAEGKLVVPFLAERYGVALESGALELFFNPDRGLEIRHQDHAFPLSPLTYPVILERAIATLDEAERDSLAALQSITEGLRQRAEHTNPISIADREAAEGLKRQLIELYNRHTPAAHAIVQAIRVINGLPGHPDSFGPLHRVLEAQAYRLAEWRVAASDINYRRFFDINTLAGLRVEEISVFEKTHALILRLVQEGRVQGLRIDHIDGLADPLCYLRILQDRIGPGFYVVVEKILTSGERFRAWPVAGTTGYEMLNALDGLFIESYNRDAIDTIYHRYTANDGDYRAQLIDVKREVLEASFSSEISVLTSDLKHIANAHRLTRDYTVLSLREALIDIIAQFHAYRCYLDDNPPSRLDQALIGRTLKKAKDNSILADLSVYDFIATTLLEPARDQSFQRAILFRRRFQQITGPSMAKSLEDTLFYRYVRLLSLNEVGGDPSRFGTNLEEFHQAMERRVVDASHALTATATHDTKRGEDGRARLHVLSETPTFWADMLQCFDQFAVPLLCDFDGELVPDPNDRYLLLQSILGAWPLAELSDDPTALSLLRDRVLSFFLKALKEAKRRTSWVHPRPHYEAAARQLVEGLLRPQSQFPSMLGSFVEKIDAWGRINTLSRTVLKATLPGVPDFYQGTELYDYALVDPDNRRIVDYDVRKALLDKEPRPSGFAIWSGEAEKLHLTAALLTDRRTSPELYASGSYQPLLAEGPRAQHLVSFLRRHKAESLIVLAPRLCASLWPAAEAIGTAAAWGETSLALPGGRWRNILTDCTLHISQEATFVRDILLERPFAVLRKAA